MDVHRYDYDVGKHGDTAAGELQVIDALVDGRADVGFVSDFMWQRALAEGDANSGAGVPLEVLPVEVPAFDHCQFDALSSLPTAKKDAFTKALYGMSWDDPEHRIIMQVSHYAHNGLSVETVDEPYRNRIASVLSVSYPLSVFLTLIESSNSHGTI